MIFHTPEAASLMELVMMEFNRHWFSFKTESYGLTQVVVDERFTNLKFEMKIGLFPVIEDHLREGSSKT